MTYPITISVQIVGGESAAAVAAALAGIPSDIWTFTISPTANQGTDWNPETTYGGFPWPVLNYSLCVAKSTEFAGCTAAGIGAPHRASVLDYSTGTPDLTQRIWHELLHGISFLESADTLHSSDGFIIWMMANYPDHAFLDDPIHYPDDIEILLPWDTYLTEQIRVSLRPTDLGIPTPGGYISIPASTPAIGDKVIGYPLASGGYFAIPMMTPAAGDVVVGLPYQGGYITTGIPKPIVISINLHDFMIIAIFNGVVMSTGYADNVGNTGGTISEPYMNVTNPTEGDFRLTWEDGGGDSLKISDTYYEVTKLSETELRITGTVVGWPWWDNTIYYKNQLVGTLKWYGSPQVLSFDVTVPY